MPETDPTSRLFDLGRPLWTGMPQSPNHPQFRMVLERRHGDLYRPGGDSAANEMIVMGCHVGTHVDALCHVSHCGELFGGVDAKEAQVGGRFRQHGAETLAPIVGRGVLLDVPRACGDHAGEAAYVITASDLDATVSRQGVRIERNDVILIRTGWGLKWTDPDAYLGWTSGVPGPGGDGIEWLCAREPRAVGSDTIAFECLAPNMGHSALPGHKVLLVDHGVPIIEAMDLEELAEAGIYEFTFIMAPLKIIGATASPVRPLALVEP